MNQSALIITSTLVTGAVGALFLEGMDFVGHAFAAQPLLMATLPLGAVLSNRLYTKLDPASDGGTNAAIRASQEDKPAAPSGMAPLIFVSTLLTHLGGGSAGREGTALQLGAGITALVAKLARCNAIAGGLATRCGLAAGFGAVFGTPATAAVFALEMHAGQPSLREALWVSAASWGGHAMATLCGAAHSTTPPPVFESLNLGTLGGLAALAVSCGVLTGLFQRALSRLRTVRAQIGSDWAIAIASTALLATLATAVPNGLSYCGLGATSMTEGAISIQSMLSDATAAPFAWLWKTVFTLITLGAGMRGGEVTPLFFMGTSLALHLASVGLPMAGVAGPVGLCLAFAAGLRAPLAAMILGFELFGWETAIAVALSAHLSTLVAKTITARESRR
jgi:H+/Cl- antiporter ClcA